MNAEIERLVAMFETYAAGCKFMPGELITPRGDSNLDGAGLPHIVLDVVERPRPQMTGDPNEAGFGARIDLRYARVVTLPDGEAVVVAFWEESWKFEPYDAPAE
jgi:hypothetical protein